MRNNEKNSKSKRFGNDTNRNHSKGNRSHGRSKNGGSFKKNDSEKAESRGNFRSGSRSNNRSNSGKRFDSRDNRSDSRGSKSNSYSKTGGFNRRGDSSRNERSDRKDNFRRRDESSRNERSEKRGFTPKDFLTASFESSRNARPGKRSENRSFDRKEKNSKFEYRNSKGKSGNRERNDDRSGFSNDRSERSDSRGRGRRSNFSSQRSDRDNSRSRDSRGGSRRSNFSDSRSNRDVSRSRGTRGGTRRSRQGKKLEISISIDKLINKRSEVEEEREFKPMYKIEDLAVGPTVKKNMLAKGFTDLTPIQDQAIPASLIGQDVVGCADTGSGKTAAFLIPIIEKSLNKKNKKSLIITPTRELALQINDEFRDLSRGLRLFSAVLIGGTDIKNQIYFLRKQHNVIVGTPGRILDLIRTGHLKLNEVETLVLDEVDRMLDMGFINDVDEIIKHVPMDRQTLFYSATLEKEVEKLMRKYLSIDFARFSVKKRDTSKNVDQDIVEIRTEDKKEAVLRDILEQDHVEKTIVFVRTKRFADRLTKYLTDNNIKVVSLHGDKSQNQRKRSLEQFKQNRADVLVATDVAARGLDIPNVSHVINYDIPETYEDYIHRIGRTGRANNLGNALNFVEHAKLSKQEKQKLFEITK